MVGLLFAALKRRSSTKVKKNISGNCGQKWGTRRTGTPCGVLAD